MPEEVNKLLESSRRLLEQSKKLSEKQEKLILEIQTALEKVSKQKSQDRK